MIVEDDDDDNDDDIPKVVQPVARNGAMAKDPPFAVTNGKPASRAKGKGKVGPSTNGHKSDAELVVIDELDDDDPSPTPPLQLAKKGKVGSTENGANSRELEKLRLERDLVRLSTSCPSLTKLLKIFMQYKEKSEQLSERFLQLIQTRNTEPEEKFESMKAQYDAASKGKSVLLGCTTNAYIVSSARGAYTGADHSDFPAEPHVEGRSYVHASPPHERGGK